MTKRKKGPIFPSKEKIGPFFCPSTRQTPNHQSHLAITAMVTKRKKGPIFSSIEKIGPFLPLHPPNS